MATQSQVPQNDWVLIVKTIADWGIFGKFHQNLLIVLAKINDFLDCFDEFRWGKCKSKYFYIYTMKYLSFLVGFDYCVCFFVVF